MAREVTVEDREVTEVEVTKVDESPPGTKQLLHQVFCQFPMFDYSASVVISSIVFTRSRIIYWK